MHWKKTRSTKCMSLSCRLKRRINVGFVNPHWCFQGWNIIETFRFNMIIFSTKFEIIINLLTFGLGSFVIFGRMNDWGLFWLLLWGYCFLEFSILFFYCSTKDFLYVSASLIILICMSLSCSVINESKKDSRVGFL